MSSVDVAMPQLGQSVSEGTVVKWLKKPGDEVARDEGLVAISTDKAEAEVPAPAKGRLTEILVEEGATVDVGTVLGRMDSDAAAGPPRSAPPDGGRIASEIAAPPGETGTAPGSAPADAGFLSPAVRALLRDRGLPLEIAGLVAGTGRQGRVTVNDLVAFLDRAPEAAAATDIEIVPMTGLRAVIAEHMLAAKRSIPHVNTVAEADMTGIVAARRAHGPAFQERHGFGLSFNAFLLRAVARSLLDFPAVNAVVDERGIVMHRRVHLGMAVALEPSGLVVPVVRDAHLLSVRAIGVEAQRLAELARKRRLLPDDMDGGTCTVTNPGVFGNLFGTPIIHAPQAAIVDFGAIKKRAVVETGAGGDSVAIRPMCYVVLAWDHRAMDGAIAARFLQGLVRELEGIRPQDGID